MGARELLTLLPLSLMHSLAIDGLLHELLRDGD